MGLAKFEGVTNWRGMNRVARKVEGQRIAKGGINDILKKSRTVHKRDQKKR